MRAVICRAPGPPSSLAVEEVAPPPLGPGEVRIAVHAAGVNFADALIVAGQYQLPAPLPFSPGFEAAGEILEIGAGVSDSAGLAPGRRVLAVVSWGGWAEELVARVEAVVPIPDRMDFVTAAGFPVAYSTARIALDERARLAAGETLLVHGVTGNLGHSAAQIGKWLGATVIATAGGAEKVAAARPVADQVIDHRAEDVAARVKELTGGRGADVVFDPVGGAVFDASLDCVAWGGRILVIGFASGQVPALPTVRMLLGNCALIGTDWGAYLVREPGLVRDSLVDLLRGYGNGTFEPRVAQVFPLEEAAHALDAVATAAAAGKVVLTTDG